MKAVVKPVMREGRASGSITLKMIWRVEQPMDWAASSTPWSDSRREASTRRATKGKAAATSGMMEATVPTLVPTMARDRGMTRIIRIRKGMDRRMLTMMLSTRISPRGSGRTPSRSPVTRMMPSGRPMT